MQVAQKIFRIVLATIGRFTRENGTLLGAGISFYALFSLAPILIFGVALIGLFLGDEAAQGLIVEQFSAYVGADVAKLIEQAILATQDSSGGVLASVAGVFVVLYGGHNIFVQLRRALNVIGGLPPEDERPGALIEAAKERGLSILALFTMGGIFIALSILTLIGRVVVRRFGDIIPFWQNLATPVDFAVTLIAVTSLVAITYRLLPTQRLEWAEVAPGAIFVGLVFFTEKWLLGLYLNYASIESAYGAAGSLIVFMLWVFLTALTYLFGASLNQELASRGIGFGRAGDDEADEQPDDEAAEPAAEEGSDEDETDAEEPGG
jgi:YihY family inner membrane protein